MSDSSDEHLKAMRYEPKKVWISPDEKDKMDKFTKEFEEKNKVKQYDGKGKEIDGI